MATLKPINSRTLTKESAYYQLSRLMAKLVRIGEYHGRKMYEVMQRPTVKMIAAQAVEKYFSRGEDTMKVKRDMRLMYQAFLVMAPILQRIPRSLHIDQHRGHVLTWLRMYAGGNAQRRFVATSEVKRVHNPALLTKRLEKLGVHDRTFTRILVALFRSYYWRDTVAGNLARLLFDPILIDVPRDRHVLRVGNRVYTLHKQGGNKTINLNKSPFVIFDYTIRYDQAALKNKLTIILSSAAIATFKKKVRGIMSRRADPKYKVGEIEKAIDRFSEKAKWAKDDQKGVIELRNWLWQTMQPLMTSKAGKATDGKKKKQTEAQIIGNKALKAEAEAFKIDVGHVPNVLLKLWMQKRLQTTGLIKARSNVLYDLDKSVPLDVFLNFLSPYREV